MVDMEEDSGALEVWVSGGGVGAAAGRVGFPVRQEWEGGLRVMEEEKDDNETTADGREREGRGKANGEWGCCGEQGLTIREQLR